MNYAEDAAHLAESPETDTESAPAMSVNQRPSRQIWAASAGIGCLSLATILVCAILAVFWQQPSIQSLPTADAAAPSVVAAATKPALSASAAAETAEALNAVILLEDDFSDPARSGLETGQDDVSRYAFENGQYAIEVLAPDLIVWSRIEGRYANLAVEVEATLNRGPQRTASGIIFRYQDDRNFYLFSVANDGFYNLEVIENGAWTTLIDWTPSDSIASEHQPNVLRVQTVGDHITLTINDIRLEETMDSAFSEGQIALVVSTFDKGGASIAFDNLKITTGE